MSLVLKNEQNFYIKQLNERYYYPVSRLEPYQRECIIDIIKLAYRGGRLDEKRSNQKTKPIKKTKKHNDDDDSD